MSAGSTLPEAPRRILFVFAWLVVGGEETEVRLLARRLDPRRYRLEVVACFRQDGMPDQAHEQLRAAGVAVDTIPYTLSFDDTVDYLARKMVGFDLVVACQAVRDVYPALERMRRPPPLIEHGGLVEEALAGPKHLTARYVGVCRAIRDAAAARLPGRPQDAVLIPSMVELDEFRGHDRASARRLLGEPITVPLLGWVGRLDRKKRVEDVLRTLALLRLRLPAARLVVVGGPDAFMPDYAAELHGLAATLGVADAVRFLGDRADVPALLPAFDALVWLSRGEGMPHVVAEAGAAGVPVVATSDNGATEQITHGVSGLFVPYEAPWAAADALLRLSRDRPLAARLGQALQGKVRAEFATSVVVPRWEALFEAVLAERRPPEAAPPPSLFQSFLQGGFECSTHRRHDRRRLDVVAASWHDRFAADDYRQLAEHGLRTVRDGVRWHLIETAQGRYDWSSLRPMLEAARDTQTQVIWDLCHYGWPDDIDVWRADFVERFAAFARAVALLAREVSDAVPFWCPVNEISFWSWGGGDVGYLNPFARGRGFELKVQLARAAAAAALELRAVDPRARLVHVDPIINIVTEPSRPHDWFGAEGHRLAQFQGWDLVAGRLWPQAGGREEHLDIVGVNYYFNNQWIHGGPPIDVGHPWYKPLRQLLYETWDRYQRPLVIAETGIEGERRADWLAYVVGEALAARAAGVPVEGVCLYPVLDHPGWDNDRYCNVGLFGMGDGRVPRPVNASLSAALARLRTLVRSTGVADCQGT